MDVVVGCGGVGLEGGVSLVLVAGSELGVDVGGVAVPPIHVSSSLCSTVRICDKICRSLDSSNWILVPAATSVSQLAGLLDAEKCSLVPRVPWV